MDIWTPNRFPDYFLTMANLEARALHNIASQVSLINIKDGLVRMRFMQEVRTFINNQLKTIRSGASDTQCQECIQSLKIEREYLTIQDRMLRTGEAVVHASIELVKGYEREIGYLINGIGIVLSTVQVVAGIGIMASSLASGNVIGVGAGFMLVLHGGNAIQEKYMALKGVQDYTGVVKQGYIETAEFLGFDSRMGREAYTGMDLALSVYGLVKYTVKPDSRRLFRYITNDYARNFRNISRASLALKIIGTGPNLKLIYDVHTGKTPEKTSY